MKAWNKGFRDGYFCAVANILRTHGEDVVARDVLRGFGAVDIENLNPDDFEVLKQYGLETSLVVKPRPNKKTDEL